MDRNKQLAQVLAEFAHTLVANAPIQEILDHLVLQISDVLPVTGSGVMLIGANDELHFVAATDDTILEIESLQNELTEGPCLEAYRTGEPVAVPDLGRDVRFPRFSAPARAAGLAAVFTFPMSLAGQRFGALDLYRDTVGPLDAEDMRTAQVLADVAVAYIDNANARMEATATAERLREQSMHDPLTGLPNRTLLRERLHQAVARSQRSNRLAAVLFVDLDRFKSINDQFGHQVGDNLLLAVATRLTRVLRPADTLARLSGDEFVVVCEDLDDAALGERVAERVSEALTAPFQLGPLTLAVTASVGLAFCGPGGDLPEILLRDADRAMYQAKKAGGGHHQVANHAARRAGDERDRLERDLRGGLERGEFRLAYQPVVDVHDRELVAVEALLRWEHPQFGLVMPDTIVPLAERSGLILPLGAWVLAQACQDLQYWRNRYGPVIPRVMVNVSPRQVMAPDFAATVATVLARTGTDSAAVFLEVTESVFLEDGPRASAVLQETRDLGVGLILDDFGTGYSSLNYLRNFPFDVLKIDRSFVTDLDHHAATRTVVAAIIDLAHGLDLAVVAEGVETARQLDQVIALGTDRAQGYFLSRPLVRDEIDLHLLEPSGAARVRLPVRLAEAAGRLAVTTH